MIQATNSHIRRLYSEKMQSEEELQEFKERTKQKIENIIEQRKYNKTFLPLNQSVRQSLGHSVSQSVFTVHTLYYSYVLLATSDYVNDMNPLV